MKKEDIEQLIQEIKEGYITKCEKPEDREEGCFECLACYAVDFLEEYVKSLEV